MKIKKLLLTLCSFLCVSMTSCSKIIDNYGYKITWLDSDGSIIAVQHDVQYGSRPYCPEYFNRFKNSGEVFCGWYPKLAEVTGDTVYKAVYDDSNNPRLYNIYYDLNGGEFNYSYSYYSYPNSFYFGQYINLDNYYSPIKDGYTFDGWYDDYDNRITILDTNTFSSIYLTARWTKIITHNVYINYYVTGYSYTYVENQFAKQDVYTKNDNEYFSFYPGHSYNYERYSFYFSHMEVNGSYYSYQSYETRVTDDLYIKIYYYR